MCSEASRPPGPIRNTALLIKITAIIKAVPNSVFLNGGGFKETVTWLQSKKAEAAPKGAFSVLPAAQATGVNDGSACC